MAQARLIVVLCPGHDSSQTGAGINVSAAMRPVRCGLQYLFDADLGATLCVPVTGNDLEVLLEQFDDRPR